MTETLERPFGLDKDDYPAGALILPCHDLARYHQFTFDLQVLDAPDGTLPLMNRSASVLQNLNAGIETMMETSAQWAWIIGDDHSFQRDTLLKLLAHDVDIVAPLCTKRVPPFPLVVYDSDDGVDEQGRTKYN